MTKNNTVDGKFKKPKKEAMNKRLEKKFGISGEMYNEAKKDKKNTGGIAGENLRRYIERIEKLENDKAEIAADIRNIYTRAKGEGFDPKVMRQALKIKRMDTAEREKMECLLDIYLHALGLQLQLPLEDAI